MGNGATLSYKFTRPSIDREIIEDADKATLKKAIDALSAELVDDVTTIQSYRFVENRHNRHALAAHITRLTTL